MKRIMGAIRCDTLEEKAKKKDAQKLLKELKNATKRQCAF